MSEINIPGVTASKYKTNELIEGLMKVERVPRDRAETELETYKKQQSAWRQINQTSTTLRDAAKGLYSFSNPFNEKLAESTDERALTASATREAKDQSFRVTVNQVAEADAFLSAELASDAKVPPGKYSFAVGSSRVSFSWKGGSHAEFADAITRRGTGTLRASLIQITPRTRSLLIESLKTGASERLTFEDDALPFALESKIIKKNDASAIGVAKDSITVGPESNGLIEFSRPAKAKDGLALEYRVRAKEGLPDPASEESTAVEAHMPSSMSWGGLTIHNAEPNLPIEPEKTKQKTTVTDDSVISLRSTRGVAIPLKPISASGAEETIRVPLAEFGDVDALVIHNRNTGKTVSVDEIKIVDPRAAGQYAPVNPVSVAQDAIIKYEGITVTRPKNDIDDLVPGVTLTLNEATAKQETVTVKPDVETAKEAVIKLIGTYNRVLAEINILTQTKPEIVEEITYFTEDEKKSAQERLGMMQGDTTLNGLKASLQRHVTGVYGADETSTTRTLAQIGVSSRSTAGGGFEASRLRGYLEIDEKKLDEALEKRMSEVKTLFGFDSDGDLVIDTGVAHAIDTNLTPYVQTGGIFAIRTSGLDTRISGTEKRITRLDEQLKAKESELKAKYGQMEGTLNSLQQQSNSISNFSNQNKGDK